MRLMGQNNRKKSRNILSKWTKSSRNYETRLNRSHNIWRMRAGPILSVLLGSFITTMPFFSNLTIIPPLGFMIFLAWRFMRPGMWPMWAGLPFGFFDDIFSGSPMGTATLSWSIAMLLAEFIDNRLIFRDQWLDWIIASSFIIIYSLFSLFIIGHIQAMPNIMIIAPQIILSIALYPLIVRFCASIDNWRLKK